MNWFKIFTIFFFLHSHISYAHEQSDRSRLHVGVITGEPMATYSNGIFSGIAIDVWRGVAEKIHVDYELLPLSEGFDSKLDALSNHTYDLIIGPITPTYDRSLKIDFSRPYLLDPITPVVRHNKASNFLVELISKTGVKFLIVLLVFLSVFFLYTFFIWRFDKKKSHRQTPFLMQAKSIFSHYFIDQKIEAPQSKAARAVHFSWLKISTLLSSFAYATFISFFTVSALHQEQSQDLYTSKNNQFLAIKGDAPYDYALQRGLRVIPVHSRDEGFQKLEKGEGDAFLDGAVIADYYILQHDLASKLVLYPEPLQYGVFAMALPYGSPWRKKIDSALLLLREDGYIHQKCAQYMTINSADKNCAL